MNGFSTQPFAVERGVRQGGPLSAYLFIIVLEILCISVRSSKDMCGIKADNEELRLSLFADELTGFLKDNLSLVNFLKLIEDYGICSGLKLNHDKSEIMLLGNCSLRAWTNDICLPTKHHQTLFGDQTFYRLDTLFGTV